MTKERKPKVVKELARTISRSEKLVEAFAWQIYRSAKDQIERESRAIANAPDTDHLCPICHERKISVGSPLAKRGPVLLETGDSLYVCHPCYQQHIRRCGACVYYDNAAGVCRLSPSPVETTQLNWCAQFTRVDVIESATVASIVAKTLVGRMQEAVERTEKDSSDGDEPPEVGGVLDGVLGALMEESQSKPESDEDDGATEE